MLEILVRQNADGSKSVTIAREARRLLLLKPAESCPECARRIQAAAGTVK
jgi:transposase-like protein